MVVALLLLLLVLLLNIDIEIGLKEYTTIINEDENYRKLKEGIRIMRSQTSDTKKDKLIEEQKLFLRKWIINSKWVFS